MNLLDNGITMASAQWIVHHLWHCEIANSGVHNIDVSDISLHGIYAQGPFGEIETNNTVSVPESTIHLTKDQTNEIKQLAPDSLVDDGNHKIWHYLVICNYLKEHCAQD